MDEIDGVGANDRGGIQALIKIIKTSQTPIICICNDVQNRKLMSLKNHCYELTYDAPSIDQIVYKCQEICRKENLFTDSYALKEIIEANRGDIRHTLNTLQLWKFENHTVNKQKTDSKMWQIKKDTKVQVNALDVAKIMLNQNEFKSIENFNEKVSMCFIDSDMIPLYIHDNYLSSMCNASSVNDIENLAKATDLMSKGDFALNQTKTFQDWSLMP